MTHAYACRTRPESATLRVALRANEVRTEDPSQYLINGDTFAVVLSEAEQPVILAAVPAGSVVEAFREALGEELRPAVSSVVEIPLPSPPGSLHGVPLDVLFFGDRNGDGQWNPGEPFSSAWDGGRGSFRLVYFGEGTSGESAARPGWNLLEGGSPVRYHADVESTVIYVEPLIEPVIRSR